MNISLVPVAGKTSKQTITLDSLFLVQSSYFSCWWPTKTDKNSQPWTKTIPWVNIPNNLSDRAISKPVCFGLNRCRVGTWQSKSSCYATTKASGHGHVIVMCVVTSRGSRYDFIGNVSASPVIVFMNTKSLAARQCLRQAIDDQLKALEEFSRTSRNRRNTLIPISQLPPETLVLIFSFLPPFACDEKVSYLQLIRVTHVCRQWRETALNYPHLWIYIDFTKLTPAGITGILARAKMLPLRLEAKISEWSEEQFNAFERQLKTHISHTRHLSISGDFHNVLEQLVSPAHYLEFLSLNNPYFPFGSFIPDSIFNNTVPKLKCVKLCGFSVNWKSSLLKGLQTLQILRPPGSIEAPKLDDWLDGLGEMRQLESLTVYSATPAVPDGDQFISEPRRTVGLPFLTQFKISASAKDCALALAHLVLPALTSLHVAPQSHCGNGEDVRLLIPFVARYAHGLQDTAPFQSMLFSSESWHTRILIWTVPDADVELPGPINLLGETFSARLIFSASGVGWWREGTDTILFDAMLTHLPLNSISTLTVQNHTRLSKEFWLSHSPRLVMLRRARLFPTAVKAIREMLDEDPPPSCPPQLPRLTKLILVNLSLTALRTYYLRDTFAKRREQGAPLEVLDLRTCAATGRAVELLSETVGSVQGPVKMLETGDPAFFNWKGGVDFFNEEEKHIDKDGYDNGPDPWNGSTDGSENREDGGVDED